MTAENAYSWGRRDGREGKQRDDDILECFVADYEEGYSIGLLARQQFEADRGIPQDRDYRLDACYDPNDFTPSAGGYKY